MRGSTCLFTLTLALQASVTHTATQLTPFSIPVRGFNSWQAFRYWITEEQVEAVAASLLSKGFVEAGYKYLVIDEGWFTHSNNTNTSAFDTNGANIDENGRWLPSTSRFPSSKQQLGFKPLCSKLFKEYNILCGVHLIGGVPIKAAHHKSPIKGATKYHGKTVADIANFSSPNGVPPMTYNPLLVNADKRRGSQEGVQREQEQQEGQGGQLALVPGAAEYFQSVVDLLVVEWGVRFIKWDFGGSAAEAQAYRDAIDATGLQNEVVFNTHGQQQAASAPAAPTPASGPGPLADMYRVSYDMWDEWSFPYVGEIYCFFITHPHPQKKRT